MNRRTIACWMTGLAASLLGLMAAGCGGASDTVTFAAALLPGEQAAYRTILDDFTAETGIEVDLVAQQYNEIQTVLEAEAQAGVGRIDLAELDLYQLALMRPVMQPLAAPAGLADQVPADAWVVGQFDGGTVYLPHRLNWQALVYDSEKIETPPATWEAMLELASRYPGELAIKGARYEGLVCDVFPVLWQAGGDPLRPDSPEAREAMIYLHKLTKQFHSGVMSFKENTIAQAQEHREILMHTNWPFVVPRFAQKGLLPEPLKTAPLPAGPAGPATVLGGAYLGIPQSAPNPERAARLVEWLTSAETQRRFVGELGWFPIREDAWSALTEADAERYAGFLAMRDHVRARPVIEAYPEISRIWQDGVYRMLFRDESIDAVLPEMQEAIDALTDGGGA